jgi:hypothetical protein
VPSTWMESVSGMSDSKRTGEPPEKFTHLLT